MVKSFSLKEYKSLYKKVDDMQYVLMHYKSRAKPHELQDFYKLSELIISNLSTYEDVDGWFIGTDVYLVPDFDLLRFLDDRVINIDLKHVYRDEMIKEIERKFKKQIELMKLINLDTYNIVFFANINKFMIYLEDKLELLSLEDFIKILQVEKNGIHYNLIESLSSKDYIVSPVSDTDKFIEGKYFLTLDQEIAVDEILNNSKKIIGVEGNAGTGKTLIAYHILREIGDRENILFIFSGKLREAHMKMEKNFKKVKFISARESYSYNPEDFSYILIDESQRLHDYTRSLLLSWISNYKSTKFVFFYDCNQALGPKDSGWLMDSLFKTYLKDNKANLIELESNLRSNKYIEIFIKQLFDLSKKPSPSIDLTTLREIIKVKYFADANHSKTWIKKLINEGYTFITPTGDNHGPASSDQYMDIESINTHNMIGSEVDRVVTYIDDSLIYSQRGLLERNSREYYYLDKEVYVNLSRTKETLALAVIGNIDIYNAILEVIFQYKNKKS